MKDKAYEITTNGWSLMYRGCEIEVFIDEMHYFYSVTTNLDLNVSGYLLGGYYYNKTSIGSYQEAFDLVDSWWDSCEVMSENQD